MQPFSNRLCSQQTPFPEPIDPKNKLWIIPQDACGFGDIACSVKIANYLVENCVINKENISIVTTKPGLVSLFNRHAVNVISPMEAKKIHVSALPQLKIVVPIRSYDNIDQSLLEDKTPFIVLWEYGIKPDKPIPDQLSQTPHLVRTLGLEEDEEGILIDKEAQDCSNLSRKVRMEKLEMINPALRDVILGEGDFKTKCNEFFENSRLYIGYATEGKFLTKFIKTIVNYNKDNSKNLTFVFPVSDDKKITLLEKLNGEIATIEVIKFDKSTGILDPLEKKVLSNDGKKITIIRGLLDFNDVKWLQIAAQRETIVTGDQSLGQTISTVFSRFIYECMPHKIELGNSLNKIYPLNPSLEIQDGKSAPKSKQMLQYFISCKEKKEQFSQASRKICINRNGFLKTHILINELLNHKN